MLDGAATRIPPTWVVMLFAAAGFLLGPLLLGLGAASEMETLLDQSGPFNLWGALIGAQTMLWILALPPLGLILHHHWQQASMAGLSVRRDVLLSALVLAVLVAALMVAASANPVPEFLPHVRWKVRVLTVAALGVALVAAASVWVIRGRLERLMKEGPTRENLKAYSDMRMDLDRLLGYLGAVVGLAVLSSAAMRNVVRDVMPNSLSSFHAEAVILYGLALSLMLAVLYLPTFAVARAVGAELRDKLAPFPEPNRP